MRRDMKKLITLLLIVFPFVALPAENPEEYAINQIYEMDIVIAGKAIGVPYGGAVTEQKIHGMSWARYTVAYTAMVDAIREILTLTWALESADLTPERVKAFAADPSQLYRSQ